MSAPACRVGSPRHYGPPTPFISRTILALAESSYLLSAFEEAPIKLRLLRAGSRARLYPTTLPRQPYPHELKVFERMSNSRRRGTFTPAPGDVRSLPRDPP